MFKLILGFIVMAMLVAGCNSDVESNDLVNPESESEDSLAKPESAIDNRVSEETNTEAKSDRTPIEAVNNTEQGELKNPYNDEPVEIVEQGRSKYLAASCNGCHGGSGGGGMGPPLSNTVWVYDGDDDTLFRLVTLGSDELHERGYSRQRTENVVGPMPPFGEIIKTEDDLWKIITFIRSNYRGHPDKKYGN